MSVSSKHILSQGPVLAGLGKTILASIQQQVFGVSEHDVEVPGEVIQQEFPPRSQELVEDYVRHVGGDPGDYRDTLPPHLFPQWGFALAPQTLIGLPYPISRAMNGGCRMEVNEPLPNDEPLQVTAQLIDVDDDGSRAVLTQEIITGTESVSEAVVGKLFVVIPLSGSSDNGQETEQDEDEEEDSDGEEKKQRKKFVPEDAKEVCRWEIDDDAGLDFAKLTGDFNPLHWVSPYAQAAGFPNVILHGFSTMARTYEGLKNEAFLGRKDISVLDVQFTKPLVLPAEVGLYVSENEVYVGDAPAGPSYMSGEFQVD